MLKEKTLSLYSTFGPKVTATASVKASTPLNRFTISLEVSLFFSPSAKFSLLVCSEVSEVTEKMLNASQMYFGFLFLKVL